MHVETLRQEIRRALQACSQDELNRVAISAGQDAAVELFEQLLDEEVHRVSPEVREYWEGACPCNLTHTTFNAKCFECGEQQVWSTQAAAQAAITWHVYAAHRQIWQELVGERLPDVAHPELLGEQLDPDSGGSRASGTV